MTQSKPRPPGQKQRTNQSRITFWSTLVLMLKEARQIMASFKPSPYWQDRLHQYGLLMRVDKPIGTLLLLWPTYWALWLATDGHPEPGLVLIFTFGVFLTRSAGCVINDYADRHFDGQIERTKNRPFATGAVNEKEALLLFSLLSILALGLVLLLNRLTLLLSIVAILTAIIYPFMKRITYFPQVVLGAAFSMSIPMAFAATQNQVPETAWLLFCANLFWVLAYDTLYAMVDKKDDLKAGIKSTAILFGEADLHFIGLIQGFFMFGMLLIGSRFDVNWGYYLGLSVAIGLVLWQLYQCRKKQPKKCFAAFLNNNWVGASLFCGILLSKLME